jgi:hypothetical protein
MEAVNAVDNPMTKKGKTRQDTINQGDKWTVNNEISHLVNNRTLLPVGDRTEGSGWGTSNEHMEINSKNPQENNVDVQ